MLDIATLQQFDFFSTFTLCAGAGGLGRSISNVVVLDHEGLLENFSDFHEGDFVLTNLFYAKDHPERIYSSFSQLMNIGVSAIAIKSIFYQELPEEVLALADKRGVPVFFFHSIYIEDVILYITDYIRSSTDYSHYEQLIDNILGATPDSSPVKELLAGMDGTEYACLSCMYLSYRKSMDNISIQRYLNKLQMKRNSLSYAPCIHFRKYKKGILFFFFYQEKTDCCLVRQKWEHLFPDLGIDPGGFDIGISDIPLSLSKTDIAIRRSIYATHFSPDEGTLSLDSRTRAGCYSTLSLDNLLLPLAENGYVQEYLHDLTLRIAAHEPGGGSQLADTLQTYVETGFKIDRTAELLFQHPNTIRYRIGKLKGLLNTPEDAGFQMLALLIVRNAPSRH